MSRNCLIATLSSGSRVFNDVVFTIPFRASTICDPCMIIGIPSETAIDSELCQRFAELQYSTRRK